MPAVSNTRSGDDDDGVAPGYRMATEREWSAAAQVRLAAILLPPPRFVCLVLVFAIVEEQRRDILPFFEAFVLQLIDVHM